MKKFFLITFFLGSNSYGVTTLYASALGCAATLPVTDPTGTLVILDVDITVSQACPLLITGDAGDLTFTATGKQQLIIAQGVQWNISSLTQPNTLYIAGNAQLVMAPGAQLLADQATGVNINFKNQAVLRVQP